MILLLMLYIFLLGSCHKHSTWHLSSLPNSIKDYDLAKLSHHATSHTGITMTLVRFKDKIDAYLEVQAFEIPSFHADFHLAKVTFVTRDKKRIMMLKRLQGGQRLHFNPEDLDKLFNLLSSYKEIKIETDIFSETIDTSNFAFFFKRLKKQSSFFSKKNHITFEFY